MRQLPMLFLLGVAGIALAPEEESATGGPAPAERAVAVAATDACAVSTLLLDSVRADFAAHLERREDLFYASPLLKKREKRALRKSRNPDHVARAQQLGIDPTAPTDDPHGEAALRCLDHRSPYYLDHQCGMPRLTDDAMASLELVGSRFHARLIELGLPPVRMAVSSAYRSAEYQAMLRRRNRNASRTTSSHEFGTTYDLAWRRFYPMAPEVTDPNAYAPAPGLEAAYACLADDLRAAERAWATQMTDKFISRFAAVLGRVLIDMEDEDLVLALREWRQPCYHITVACEMR